MKNISLVSIRNDFIVSRSENRDSIDTEIYKLLSDIGLIPFLIPNDTKFIFNLNNLIDNKRIKCLLLSGGNDLGHLKKKGGTNISYKRDEVELELINYCLHNKIPIIGICRGFQLIASHLGAEIDKVDNHINTFHKIKLNDSASEIKVNSFHSFGLKNNNLPINIKPLGSYEKDNTIECFTTELPFRSINFMWHPERKNGAKEETTKLIKAFLNSEN